MGIRRAKSDSESGMIIAGFEAAEKGRMSVDGRKEIDESFDAFYPSRH